ncbi:hypothetical protein G3N95_21450 [Paraburkholderia sp. Tr-20389]|uniref:hypothetical protein n=1 Tax=Paraburkholderia sp. Tr-20389 TaxID=2703903 RepID=UPI00197DF995|nr:hypothetical protein [Paraburkholderia sp. Tr-20389]MBN3755523.1 hypothetical protein [Paraburkholderia sp. Tr-20389]
MLNKLIDIARHIRRSERFKHSISTPGRITLHAQQRLNRGYFAIEIRAHSGFFSVMQMVLFILMYCDEKRLTPLISARGGIYGDPEGQVDWFGEYFDTVGVPASPASNMRLRTSVVHDLGGLGFRRRYESKLELRHASALFRAHYQPTAPIRAEVDAIRRRTGIGAATLGVHFRGTDKKLEAHTIGWDEFCRLVERTLAEEPQLTNIFVSSDEQAFLDFFVKWGFRVPVSVAPARLLATGGTPVHFSGHPGLAIGREALVASLLLANCGYLLKTPSYLSAWSKIFNPSLPVRLAVPPREGAFWFPDSQIWTEQKARRRDVPEAEVRMPDQKTA